MTTPLRQKIVDVMDDGEHALGAIGSARDAARAAEEGLAMTVAEARGAGHSWAQIGAVLGVSRQAAFQRFGRPTDPRTGTPMADAALPDAADRAMTLFADLADGRWASVARRFDATVAAQLDSAGVAAVWAQVIGTVGAFDHLESPVAHQAGDLTVADVPLFFEAGARTGRISLDRSGQVAGLFILPGQEVDEDIGRRPDDGSRKG
ncbi:MAG TPA: DUF3887 domain-containing protein [Mycobacteriales bacterium]|nr:DUF3887 domain-containing protein [Mycobacteriales bacterium]